MYTFNIPKQYVKDKKVTNGCVRTTDELYFRKDIIYSKEQSGLL